MAEKVTQSSPVPVVTDYIGVQGKIISLSEGAKNRYNRLYKLANRHTLTDDSLDKKVVAALLVNSSKTFALFSI